MKNSIIFILTLLVFSTTCAQISVNGKITDQSGRPVFGATIAYNSQNSDVKGGTITQEQGEFSFKLKETGTYQLTVGYIGMETLSLKKSFNQIKDYDLGIFQLQESLEQLQSVEVIGRARTDYNSDYSFSATKVAIKNKELPQAISTVTKELIADRQAFKLADAVKVISGVTPSSNYNQYNIRGISQNEEGQIINGLRTRQFYFLQPLTSNIEKVEVIKGPASASFASVDPGGSINMVTKKPLKEDRKEVTFAVGSFSTVRGSFDFTGPLNEDKTLLYRFNAAYEEAGSYRDLINNKSILISPSFSYLPNDKTAINIEMIYNDMNGFLDRGQPIFGATDGVTSLTSTPISLNLGAPNDFFNSKEFILMGSLSHKFSDAISFNTAYMKQTWKEDLEEHRTTNAFAADIEGNSIPSLAAMRFVQRKQNWMIDNLNAYFNFDFKTGSLSHKLLVGYDLHYWKKQVGGGQNSARGYLLNDGSITNSFDVSNAANYQTTTYNGTTIPLPDVPHFNLENPDYSIKLTEDYTFNSKFAIPPALTTSNAFYVQEQLKWNKFSLLLGLRAEWFGNLFRRVSATIQHRYLIT